MNLADRLSACKEFSCVFGVVKAAVEKTIHKRRGGLLLGLSYLPNQIGAFYQVGSNFIVMNKSLLEDVLKTRDRELINSYVFHIILHEYLHSLGFLDEQQTGELVQAITEEALGSEHPATLIAKHGISSMLPDIGRFERHANRKWNLEIVQDFEVDDLDYLG